MFILGIKIDIRNIFIVFFIFMIMKKKWGLKFWIWIIGIGVLIFFTYAESAESVGLRYSQLFLRPRLIKPNNDLYVAQRVTSIAEPSAIDRPIS